MRSSGGANSVSPLNAPTRVVDLNFQGATGAIAAFLFDDGREVGLVETGPASTLPYLLEAIQSLENGLDRLTTVVVTHIHLDHAGAVGQLLNRAPNARVYVHEVGAPHLIDPTKLLRSAARIYGNQMGPLWGEVVPASAERVVPLRGNELLSVGGHGLRVLYTPGHASHHIALYDEADQSVFTGDVAGVRMQNATHVRPPTPPPDIDVDLWKASIERLTALRPAHLYLTHFGRFDAPLDSHFESLVSRLDAWTDLVRTNASAGEDAAAIVDSLRREGDAEAQADGAGPDQLHRYDLATPYGMNVDGLLRFLRKTEGLETVPA